MIRFKDFGADVGSLHVQLYISIVEALFGYFFQFIESIFTVTRLVSACLGHAAHPFQFRAIKVIGTGYLGIGRLDAFLAFFQIIAIISFV